MLACVFGWLVAYFLAYLVSPHCQSEVYQKIWPDFTFCTTLYIPPLRIYSLCARFYSQRWGSVKSVVKDVRIIFLCRYVAVDWRLHRFALEWSNLVGSPVFAARVPLGLYGDYLGIVVERRTCRSSYLLNGYVYTCSFCPAG